MVDRKQFAKFAARYMEARAGTSYHYDGSPIHIFELYRFCRRSGQPIPEIVFSYLDEVAERLHEHEPKNAREVAEAFGMAGRKRRNAKNHNVLLATAQHVWAWQEAHPDTPDQEVFEKVAESMRNNPKRSLRRYVSPAYVKKAYETFPRR